LDQSKVALAQRMRAGGEAASTMAATLGVSKATLYRALAEQI
jgi:DNA invertase Pin-like site-specific DNA recombinase